MLKGCLKSLALLAVLYAAYFVLLRSRFPEPNAMAAAAALGFVMWIAVGLLLGALNAARQGRMLRRALDGKPFEDGERVAVAGSIRPLNDPLRAPFSLRECWWGWWGQIGKMKNYCARREERATPDLAHLHRSLYSEFFIFPI